MTKYEIDHLTQDERQEVWGPIQDDEALLLYSLVKVMRMKRILEVGGLNGYSARNFLAAMDEEGLLYTVDVNPVEVISNRHKFIRKEAGEVIASDFPNEPLDMVFFDCHHRGQMTLHERLSAGGLIDHNTILALHDTNVHYDAQGLPRQIQFVEREMTNHFKKMGHDVICLHPKKQNLDERMPFRHGLSLCLRFSELNPDPRKIKLI